MNRHFCLTICFFSTFLALQGCEDEINPELDPAASLVVVDAWVNDQVQEQVIWLGRSAPYFDSSFSPGIDNAQVTLIDQEAHIYDFFYRDSGRYVYTPTTLEQCFKEGQSYELKVTIDDVTFSANAYAYEVAPLDSVTFDYEEGDGFYYGLFWARDLVGAGNFYWIKSFVNGVFQNSPSAINIAADGGFSVGGVIDGMTFIQPIRYAVSPNPEDENGELLSPFKDGDHLRVELHSISKQAFEYLNQIRLVTDRPGGFAELFATPLSNVDGNISASNGEPVLGFFNVAVMSSEERTLVEAEVN